jgi:hypothetical protein
MLCTLSGRIPDAAGTVFNFLVPRTITSSIMPWYEPLKATISDLTGNRPRHAHGAQYRFGSGVTQRRAVKIGKLAHHLANLAGKLMLRANFVTQVYLRDDSFFQGCRADNLAYLNRSHSGRRYIRCRQHPKGGCPSSG